MLKGEQAARHEGSIENECHCLSVTLTLRYNSIKSPFHPLAVRGEQHWWHMQWLVCGRLQQAKQLHLNATGGIHSLDLNGSHSCRSHR